MITISPAYLTGRDIQTKVQALLAFDRGQEFVNDDPCSGYPGRYCSIRTLRMYTDETCALIRYEDRNGVVQHVIAEIEPLALPKPQYDVAYRRRLAACGIPGYWGDTDTDGAFTKNVQ